jgi:hypothetical protein
MIHYSPMENITTTTPTTTLTPLETEVLTELLKAADGNGYDFAFTEDITCVPMHVARGVLSSLIKKDIIYVWDPVKEGWDTEYHQVTFNHLDRMIEEPTITDLLPR